jgi:hypothetical protein
MLEEMRIGTLPESERITVDENPYANDPERDPSLVVRSATPFNGEAPVRALLGHVTPTTFHFKRNHMPVPEVLPEAYELQVRAYTCARLSSLFN